MTRGRDHKAERRARMSPTMWTVLGHIYSGRHAYYGCTGRSQWGGRGQTVDALRDRGYLTADNQITDAGTKAIKSRNNKG